MWIIVISWESEAQDAYAPYESQEEAHTVAQQIAAEIVREGELTETTDNIVELRDSDNVGWGAQIQNDTLIGYIDVQVMGPVKRHDQ